MENYLNRFKEGTEVSAFIKDSDKIWEGIIVDDLGIKKVVREDYRWIPLSKLTHIKITRESEDICYEAEPNKNDSEGDLEEELLEMTIGEIRKNKKLWEKVKSLKEVDLTKDDFKQDTFSEFTTAALDANNVDYGKLAADKKTSKEVGTALQSKAKSNPDIKDKKNINDQTFDKTIQDAAKNQKANQDSNNKEADAQFDQAVKTVQKEGLNRKSANQLFESIYSSCTGRTN